MKVELNREQCFGCGMCASNAPKNFQMDDEDGLSNLINEEATEEAVEVSEMCPAGAISIVEEANKEEEK